MRSSPKKLGWWLEHLDPRLFFLLAATAILAFASRAQAQPAGNRAAPHLAFAYPAGGQQGTTFTVTVCGQYLNATAAAHFSGSGLVAKVVNYERPLNQKEINDLREEADKLLSKRAAARSDPTKPALTPEDEKRGAEIRTLLSTRGNRQVSPVLAEAVTLEVTILPNAAPGEREVRLRTPGGLSNPMVFVVSQLPEIREPVHTAMASPNQNRKNPDANPRTQRTKSELEITVPAVVNGQILPGEVDRFRFTAKKGQRIVMVASARALIPYLADAVPGWFQATLAVYDTQGRELAYADDYRFNPDPVLRYDIPADGTYFVEIKDAIYRGREDFVYRVAIGELPFITGIYPLGAACGERATFELSGWNLPSTQLPLDTKDKSPGTFYVSVRGNNQLSNPARITLDTLPNTTDVEPNDRPDTAQNIALPVTVNGRIDRPGDEDVFRFTGKAGEEIVAEIFARRLGTPLDSVLRLTDAAGKQVAFNDDNEDKGSGLLTHHADSRLTCKLPADGAYTLTLADTQHQGGPDYAYRLRVGPPRPDFELRVAPSSINVKAGASVAVTVFALRHDGFNGEIVLQLRDAPWGFGLSGARIPADQDKVQLTITAPYGASDELFDLTIAGLTTIGGKTVVHAAVPAEDMMQAFAYKHLVASKELMLNVAGRGAPFRVVTKGPLKLTPGSTVKLQIAAPAARTATNVQFELLDPPEGIAIEGPSRRSGDVVTITLACDPAKAKAGSQGNLMLAAFGERPTGKAKVKANANAQRVPLGTVPAIPFQVAGAKAPSAD